MYFFNDFYGGGFCFYFAISLIFYIFTFFAIYSLYEEIDAKVLARFANGDYCGGVIVCTDSGRMVVQGIASRTYRMSIKGECVKIASSSYSYKKINFQSEACKKE